MILRLIAVPILSLCMVSGVFAQAKVGSAPQFLHISPSVRGIAMGQTAVTSLDSRSYYFNPGSLALINVQRVALSFNPASSRLGSFGSTDFKSHTEGIVVQLMNSPLGGGSFELAFGYMYSTWSVGPLIETTEAFPEGTGGTSEFIDRGHSFSIGGAYKGSIEFGLGTTVRYITEDIFDVHADGVGFDIGTMFRIPLFGSLSSHDSNAKSTRLAVRAGASVTNLGSGLKRDVGGTSLPGNPRRRVAEITAPFPTRGRFGVGLDFSSGFVSLSPVIELTVANNDERGDLRLGMEAGLFNTLFVRAGRSNENDDDFVEGISENSYGFGFSTQGLREIITESDGGKTNGSRNLLGYLAKNLNLTFSFAHLDSERIGFDDPNYYQIEITL